MDSHRLLFDLVGVAVCGKEPTEALKQACTPEALEAAYSIGVKHDLSHLVGQSAGKLQLADSETLKKCKQAAMKALIRYTRQEIALRNVCNLLEQEKIPFIPLKGSVLRGWYPEPWLRTSCDLDVLVREADLAQAQKLLEEEGWKYEGSSFHDIGLLSPQGVHLELHFSTIEDCVSEEGAAIMEGIWADAKPLPGTQYHLTISDGLFYFYHIAHMAKHFLGGGCGIRSFLDIWILNHSEDFDPAARKALLQRGGLTAFAAASEKLAEIWFSGAPMDEMSQSFQEFVLLGGTYGTLQNRVSLQQGYEGSKWRFALKRVFQPYDILKHRYPVLQNHKWLTPMFQLVRWFQLLFGGGVKRSANELKTAAQVSGDTRTAAQQLLEHLGL